MSRTQTIHATCVAIGGRAVLLAGPSGAGKSDLALRLIDEGAALVSDDYTELQAQGGTLLTCAPTNIRGRIEVRGLGIVDMEPVEGARASLVVELAPPASRLPERATRTYLDIAIPAVTIDPRAASAPAKVRLALRTHGLP